LPVCAPEGSCSIRTNWQAINRVIRNAWTGSRWQIWHNRASSPLSSPFIWTRGSHVGSPRPPKEAQHDASALELDALISRQYQHGFYTAVDAIPVPCGLSEDVIRLISAKKNEPRSCWRGA